MTQKRRAKGSKTDPIPEIIARVCIVREKDKLVMELVEDFAPGCTRERYRQILVKMKRQYREMERLRGIIKEAHDACFGAASFGNVARVLESSKVTTPGAVRKSGTDRSSQRCGGNITNYRRTEK